MTNRCSWADSNDRLRLYHDTEWGVPLHDDQKLFEFLILDCFQAGLSWQIVLDKRAAFRRAFDDFDIPRVAAFGPQRVEALLHDSGIVRNRLKINAAISNAARVLEIQAEFGSFDRYLWQFTSGKMQVNTWQEMRQIPAVSPEAEAMSLDLRKRGLKFVGPTICYAVMQSIGMVNDHLTTCFRHAEVQAAG